MARQFHELQLELIMNKPVAVVPISYMDTAWTCWEPELDEWTLDYIEGKHPPHYPVPAIPARVDWQNVFCLGSIYQECRISTNNGWNTLKSWKW